MRLTEITNIQSRIPEVLSMLSNKIVGQEDTIQRFIAACLAGGHVLLEDVPGTGKTTLAAGLAEVFGLEFRRIQGTPDLLPADVVGATVYSPQDGTFNFHAGPIFTNVLLMDEINRATPRTQSALLEAMAERQVSVDGVTYPMSHPFFVIATANPIESQGVFPLPEAQLDRFFVQLKLGYVSLDDEMEMVRRNVFQERVTLHSVLTSAEVVQAQQEIKQVFVSDAVLKYIVDLARATRHHDQIVLGASPRAIIALTQYAQALAYISGHMFVTPDDVKRAFHPVMAHRLQSNVDWMGASGSEKVLDEVISQVQVPNERVEV